MSEFKKDLNVIGGKHIEFRSDTNSKINPLAIQQEKSGIEKANDKFFQNLIKHYKVHGDTESARRTNEFYNDLRKYSRYIYKDNERIINNLTNRD